MPNHLLTSSSPALANTPHHAWLQQFHLRYLALDKSSNFARQ
jgi:hypothetical protein